MWTIECAYWKKRKTPIFLQAQFIMCDKSRLSLFLQPRKMYLVFPDKQFTMYVMFVL